MTSGSIELRRGNDLPLEALMSLYASLGFKNTRDLVKTPLNAFVRMANIE